MLDKSSSILSTACISIPSPSSISTYHSSTGHARHVIIYIITTCIYIPTPPSSTTRWVLTTVALDILDMLSMSSLSTLVPLPHCQMGTYHSSTGHARHVIIYIITTCIYIPTPPSSTNWWVLTTVALDILDMLSMSSLSTLVPLPHYQMGTYHSSTGHPRHVVYIITVYIDIPSPTARWVLTTVALDMLDMSSSISSLPASIYPPLPPPPPDGYLPQ